MSDVQELYQELILDHNKRPRNCHDMPDADRKANGYNPLCGDKITVFLQVEDDVVKDVAFQGSGCAISTASSSLMTEAIKGKPLAEAKALFHKFHDLVTGHAHEGDEGPKLGKLEALAGVQQFPIRVKCATLVWHTLMAAIEGKGEAVSTE